MIINEQAVTVANDDSLSALILNSKRRVFLLAPAVSCRLAEVLIQQWDILGRDGVTVVLDVDAEVYRLGYGDPPALKQLEEAAAKHGTTLNTQPGIRIGLLIADDEMLVFSPTPQLIEANPKAISRAVPEHVGASKSLFGDQITPSASASQRVATPALAVRPNAIRIGPPPAAVERDVGQGPNGVKDQTIGLDKAAKSRIASVEKNLNENPPQKFDVSRSVRVFNAAFEFVEFELSGTYIDRKKVQIPKHLSGIADARTRDQLNSTFNILPPDHKLSGEHLQKDKALIVRKFLRTITNFGSAVLRRNKVEFEKDVEQLRADVAKFAESVKNDLQAAMDKNRESLVKAMLPLVKRTTPKEWCRSDGTKPDADTLRQFLDNDLRQAFGTAERLIKQMEVRLVFKGVTYELLTNEGFIKNARQAIPELNELYNEFDAAKAVEQKSK